MTDEMMQPLFGMALNLLVCFTICAIVSRLFHSVVVRAFRATIDNHFRRVDEMTERHTAEHMRIMEMCGSID